MHSRGTGGSEPHAFFSSPPPLPDRSAGDGMQRQQPPPPPSDRRRMPSSPSSPFNNARDVAMTTTSALLLLFLSSVLVVLLLLNDAADPFRPVARPPHPCDYSYGKWVRDDDAPSRSYAEDCPFLDPGFRCRRNGRVDSDYLNWRWKPRACDLPRFNGTGMVEMYRNKRIVFAGDSIGRNQWESLVCMLAKAVGNRSAVFEKNGKPISKHKGYLSIMFQAYNLTVEYYRVPFLVVIGPPPSNSSRQINKAIHVDRLHWLSSRWVGADLAIFNAGHWWTQDKTMKMGFYFQEHNKLNLTMNTREAFRRALGSWKRWVLGNLSCRRSRVFFRTYSPVHFRGGAWDKGGSCDGNAGPETRRSELEPEPWNNRYISEAVEEMKKGTDVRVQLLNITYLTEFRNDGHPSSHREAAAGPQVQDCSHWCLPGVPDTWNELLYAHLLL